MPSAARARLPSPHATVSAAAENANTGSVDRPIELEFIVEGECDGWRLDRYRERGFNLTQPHSDERRVRDLEDRLAKIERKLAAAREDIEAYATSR